MSEVDEKVEAPIIASDDDMEEPATKNYDETPELEKKESTTTEEKKVEDENVTPEDPLVVVVKQEFVDDVINTIGTLPHGGRLGSAEKNIPVSEIVNLFKDVVGKPLTEQQANQVISLLELAPYNLIASVINNVHNNQSLYFNVFYMSQLKEMAEAQKESTEETTAE